VKMKVAVIGIGQTLRGDDAVGLEAVHSWQKRYPETADRRDIRVEFCELPGLALIDILDDLEAVILVDAVKSYSIPGTIHKIQPDQLSAFTPDSRSAHGWGLAETLQLDRKLNPSRQDISIQLIGTEAEQTELGSALNKSVMQANPEVCEAIKEKVQTILVS